MRENCCVFSWVAYSDINAVVEEQMGFHKNIIMVKFQKNIVLDQKMPYAAGGFCPFYLLFGRMPSSFL
jgi:hypothetical protein